MVATVVAHLLEIIVFPTRTNTLLRIRHLRVGRLFFSQQHILELVHAGVDEKQAGIILRHHGARWHDRVAIGREKIQKFAAHFRAREICRCTQTPRGNPRSKKCKGCATGPTKNTRFHGMQEDHGYGLSPANNGKIKNQYGFRFFKNWRCKCGQKKSGTAQIKTKQSADFKPINQSTNQSTNQTIDQSINRTKNDKLFANFMRFSIGLAGKLRPLPIKLTFGIKCHVNFSKVHNSTQQTQLLD